VETVVHRLRIGTDLADAHAVQSRVAAQLRAADLCPAGLPPGATLVVRRLHGLPPWHLRPQDIWPPKEWQAAARERLAGLLREAAWVRGGIIPDDPIAIVFAEQADLLAAQASDWVSGALHSRWCWKSLYPREDPVAAMVRIWMEKPEAVPAAMERLAVIRRAEVFVARLPDAVVEALLMAEVRVFALRHVEEVLARVAASEPPAHGSPEFNEDSPVAMGRPAAAVPRVGARRLIEIRQELLLEIALKLQTSPAVARSAGYAARLGTRLLREIGQALEIAAEAASAEQLLSRRRDMPPVLRDAAPPPSESLMLVPVPIEEFASAAPGVVEAPQEPSAPAASPASERFEILEIQTAFGGIFYLINLAIYLGYYEDFSTPEEPGIDLPIWDFLAQTGRELAGKPLLKDPVWRFLQSLGEGEPWEQLDEAMVRIRGWLTERVPDFTLEHAARVTLSDTRLDIFLFLDELPVEIRIARLDRDPGWIPAAGRWIAFHFL
jgi:hypothetical protein